MEPLTDHLDVPGQTDQQAARDKEAIIDLMKQPGWQVLLDSARKRADVLNGKLIHRGRPMDTPAEYEAVLGEIRGVESIEALADGVVLAGEEAEARLSEEPAHA